MGERTKARPVTSGRVPAALRARVRARALGVLVRAARRRRQRAHRGARARRQPLLRPRLHALAEALDAAEHRHRRRRRRGAAARRLGGRDRQPDGPGAAAVRDRLLLDAAALLGARAADQAELRRRRHADAAGRARRARDGQADPPLLGRARRGHASCRSSGARSGSLYLVAALALGAGFVWLAVRLRRRHDAAPRALLLFHYSLLYLALLFVAAALDPIV